jgi:hypothetical protein
MMTAVTTLRNPRAEHRTDDLVPLDSTENDEPEALLDERTRRYLAIDERDILEGQSVYPPLTLKEIVAICKEARAERYASDPAPQPSAEADDQETSLERYRRWCRECDERREREGPPYPDPPPTMEEIVAIIKEVRAEMYAEEQERENTGCR